MKHIHMKKPDIKGFFQKIRNLKMQDIKEHFKERKERRRQILEKRRNGKFARKMQPVYRMMNRLSLVLHYLLACVLNFIIEIISRHSLFEAWDYLVGTPKVFFFNAFLIFATFSIVYLVRRRVFARILLSVFWLALGVCNGYMLLKRVTPFNAQDLKAWSEGLAVSKNYFSAMEFVLLGVGIVAVILWVISMWRRGGQYTGKMHRVWALFGVVISIGAYIGLTNIAIDKRVVSNYFGNIAFAYEDYGFPYCFAASVFNTGISEPSGYSKETMDEITEDVVIDQYDENDWPIRPEALKTCKARETQILKQPDVVLLLHLLGEEFESELMKENYDYYEKRTLHGSSLSPSIYSVMGLKVGDDSKAYRYLKRAALIDLLNLQKNTREGIHAANAGGVWQTIVFGFAGVSIGKDGILNVKPNMPKEWSSLKFRLHYDNAWLEIRTDGNNQAEVRRLDGAPVGIWINGEKKEI